MRERVFVFPLCIDEMKKRWSMLYNIYFYLMLKTFRAGKLFTPRQAAQTRQTEWGVVRDVFLTMFTISDIRCTRCCSREAAQLPHKSGLWVSAPWRARLFSLHANVYVTSVFTLAVCLHLLRFHEKLPGSARARGTLLAALDDDAMQWWGKKGSLPAMCHIVHPIEACNITTV